MAYRSVDDRIRLWYRDNYGGLPLDLGNTGVYEIPKQVPFGVGAVIMSDNPVEDITWVPKRIDVVKYDRCPLNGRVAPPNHIKQLSMVDSGVSKIESLPTDLLTLDLSNCQQLRRLPNLPSNLYWLDLRGSAIEEVPELPESLTTLNISNCSNLPADFPVLSEKKRASRFPYVLIPEMDNYIQEVRNYQARKRVQARVALFKEELVANAFRPSRVEKWTNEQYDMMFGL